jgi:hypothetical protein
MIEGSAGADAHEFRRPDLDHRDAGVVLKMRNDVIGHGAYFLNSKSVASDTAWNLSDSRGAAAGPYWAGGAVPSRYNDIFKPFDAVSPIPTQSHR